MGFTARALARRLDGAQWRITGTVRDGIAASRTERHWRPIAFEGRAPSPELATAIGGTTHLLVSAPPDAAGDPLLAQHRANVESAAHLLWIGYLSTTGVYGDHGGAWIDETTPVAPRSDRAIRRVAAEDAWLALSAARGVRVQVFRLSGIYGPGRSAIDQVRAGTARCVIKPGQIFNRIHVEDIASALEAAMIGRGQHAIYNLADDEPAPPEDVVRYAAFLLGVPPPPAIAFEDAQLSGMARSFYEETKRVRNSRMKQDLGITLRYPTHREGLAAIASA
jgi:nucleoside-diphosphate-sugar epimerase